MAKFHIVDKDLEIVDSSDNMLALRLTCKDVNERFYGIGDECTVMSDRELKVEILVNYDIDEVKKGIAIEDVSFLADVLSGNGWKPYNQLTDEQIETEYNEMLAMKKELAVS